MTGASSTPDACPVRLDATDPAGLGEGDMLTVVGLLQLDGWDVAAGFDSRLWLNQSTHSRVAISPAQQSARPTGFDQFGFEQAGHRLGQRALLHWALPRDLDRKIFGRSAPGTV